MNRRILLIDADPGFHQDLISCLRGYRLDVIVELDPDQGVALGQADPPALLIVGVEEPDKSGFKVFQRCKKGALAGVPILLVTASVSPENFAKHGSLKTHADAYLDKRAYAPEALRAIIDGLITLGAQDPEVADDADGGLSIDIPMEIDDIPLAEDDMVLEEEVGEVEMADDGDGGGGLAALEELAIEAPAPAPVLSTRQVDSTVDADIEDAFGGLLGDDFGHEPGPGELEGNALEAAAPVEVTHDAFPEPVPEVGADSVPEVISPSSELPVLPLLDGVPRRVGAPTMPPPFGIDEADRHGELPALPDDDLPSAYEAPADHDAVPAALDAVPADHDAVPAAPPSSHPEAALLAALGPLDDLAARPDDETFALDQLGIDEQLGGSDELQPAEPAPEPIAVHGGAGIGEGLDIEIEAPAPAATDIGEPGFDAPVDELAPIEELAAVEVEAPVEELAAVEVEAPVEELAAVEVEAPIEVEAPPSIAGGRQGLARLESAPAIMLDSIDLMVEDGAGDAEPVVEIDEPAPAVEPEPAAIPRTPSGGMTVADLGLDAIAEDANREQSGVYDRRALRTIHELERQVGQLKTELDKARAAAPASTPGGRQGEFLKLRETLLAATTDLKQAKDELAARDRDLGDIQSELHSVRSARQALETRAAALEQRAAAEAQRASAETERAGSLDGSLRALAAELTGAQHELAERSAAALTTTAERDQLARDLASERTLRAASATDAEQALRAEREQLRAQHQAELEALRGDTAAAHGAALAALQQELEGRHASAVAAALAAARQELTGDADHSQRELAARHASELEDLRAQHAAAIATATDQLARAHASELARVQDELTAQLAAATAERDHAAAAHAGAQAAAAAALTSERDQATAAQAAAVAAITAEREQALATLTAEREQALATLTAERDHATAALTAERDHATAAQAAAVAAITTERDQAIAAQAAIVAAITTERDQALAAQAAAVAGLAAEHAQALAAQAAEHERAAAERATAHAAELARVQGELTAEVAAARAEREQDAGAQATALEAARRELEALRQQHEVRARELTAAHQQAFEDQAAQHAAALAAAATAEQQAVAEAQRAAEAVATQHAAQLAAATAEGTRAAGELERSLAAAQQALVAAQAAQAQALAEQTEQHERVFAAAQLEAARQRTVLETEHQQALGTAGADTARAIADLTAERDELRLGLSSAREAHKRLEGDLATTVQALADRNADLRAHGQAITERDQRLEELRREIQTVEQENAGYQEQVLRAYQKIKTDEAMVARAKKAMAIALTVLDEPVVPAKPE